MLKRRIRNLAVTGITIIAAIVFTTLGAIAVPAMASQAAPAQPAQAPQVAGHQVSASALQPLILFDANRQAVAAAKRGHQFTVISSGIATDVAERLLGHVNSPAGWPFSDRRFDRLYARDPVVQILQLHSPGGCMQTDSVHSGVVDDPCGSHKAGTYWVLLANRGRGFCRSGAAWQVNVGITNHYRVYPYGYAMFVNSNNRIYTGSHHPISVYDQWCVAMVD
jgi:hypothetical protein